MTDRSATAVRERDTGSPLLAILLAMAMFVLVVDTSLMNVSISSVVHDLHTTVSGVQSAIALEALVSAAFILIGSKVGDLIGRKKAYVLGLLGYAIGALAMTVAQDLIAIIVFWAIIGGLGASLLLPSMQSLIHGNFEGAAQKKAYAMVGAAAAIAAAVGPLLGGFITTYLSWRVGFLLEDIIIVVVLSGLRLVRDAPYTGPRQVDVVGSLLSVVGMGGVVLSILVWQEGGESVGALLVLGFAAQRISGRSSAGFLAAGFFLASPYVFHTTPLARVNALALLLAVLGLACCYGRGWGWHLGAVVLFVAALFAKQTMADAVAAGVLALMLRDLRRGLLVGAAIRIRELRSCRDEWRFGVDSARPRG